MAAPLAAATPNEFYTGLLRRGIASYDASRYADGSKQLRLAAFGLVEAVDQYQVAQIYLALTFDKLGETDRAREAAHRVVVAERVERRFASLTVPATVRSAFDALSARLLSATEATMLRSSAANMPTPVPVPRASTPPQAAPKPQTTPQNTTPQTTKPQTTTAPAMATPPAMDPEKPKPQTQPIKPPQTAAPSTTTTTVKPQTQKPPTQKPPTQNPTVQKPAPAPTPKPATPTPVASTPAAATPRTPSATEVSTRLTASERALNGGNLVDARRLYRELLAASGLDHDTLIRIAEGLYRSRDFGGSLSAFNRVGALRRGEEPYRYYIAVAAYETGDLARAKKELAAALPFIEITPDVARYRSKIESAL